MPLFDRYLFADYSGAQANNAQNTAIRLWRAVGDEDPHPFGPNGAYTRETLRQHIVEELIDASENGERVVFGFDHQYGWPPLLNSLAGPGVVDQDWPTAVLNLVAGAYGGGQPGPVLIDNPQGFAADFNAHVGEGVFWTGLHQMAENWGLPNQPLQDRKTDRFRLVEITALLTHPAGNPAAADMLGGPTAVAGQTICGLFHIAQMLQEEAVNVAWWPFDGLEIDGEAYQDKHVAVEIYPSIFPMGGWDTVQAAVGLPADADHDRDAWRSTRLVQHADRPDIPARLPGITGLWEMLNLNWLGQAQGTRVRKEGWMIGVAQIDWQHAHIIAGEQLDAALAALAEAAHIAHLV